MIVTPRVLNLFLKYEGLNQPGKVPPLDTSGITIGYGYDLGHQSRDQFTADWKDILPRDHHDRLRSVCGLKGPQARGAALGVRDIVIRKEDALKALSRTIDRYGAMTLKAFPGLEKYPADVQGAITSVVYVRGPMMDEDPATIMGREEMSDLRDLIAQHAECEEIGEKVANMEHLWQDMNVDGLIARFAETSALIKAADDPPGLAA
jgi:hypothetical protein